MIDPFFEDELEHLYTYKKMPSKSKYYDEFILDHENLVEHFIDMDFQLRSDIIPNIVSAIFDIYLVPCTQLGGKKSHRVAINRYDIFRNQISDLYIQDLFQFMNSHQDIIFLLRTDNLKEMLRHEGTINWGNNVLAGALLQSRVDRVNIEHLTLSGAEYRFLLVEPLYASLDNINLKGIHWVICGGISGDEIEPLKDIWVSELRDICIESGVPFFFRNWGGNKYNRNNRIIEGREWSQLPYIFSNCEQ